jgi:1D-myo-inositol-tetrakisphosphate 5-kinase/inositol-polyphosphate multikinase
MIDKKQLTTVAHQVAGHGQDNKNIGLLQDGDTVLKPIHLSKKAGKCELEFYERMIHHLPKSLIPFLPRYYGLEQVIDSSTKSVQDYLRLENLLQGYRKPSLIDIKLGYRTYDEDATTLKISQEISKYFYQKTIGFRLSGMKIYDSDADKYHIYTRKWGRSVTPSRMREELRKFFYPIGPSLDREKEEIVRKRLLSFVEKLQQLLRIFQLEQDKYRFYASSILCVYEGDWNAKDTLMQCELRLIDFAHVFPIKESESEDERKDNNVIFGLRNVLNYLIEMRDGITTPSSPFDITTVIYDAQ